MKILMTILGVIAVIIMAMIALFLVIVNDDYEEDENDRKGNGKDI